MGHQDSEADILLSTFVELYNMQIAGAIKIVYLISCPCEWNGSTEPPTGSYAATVMDQLHLTLNQKTVMVIGCENILLK